MGQKRLFLLLCCGRLANAGSSFIFWVPSIMVSFASMDLLSKIDLSCLKTVWFAGEVFPTEQVQLLEAELLPTRGVAGLYGPIEITLDCTDDVADREIPENEPLPIGLPCRNTDVLILNDENQPCNVGEKGELCVRGSLFGDGLLQ